MHSKYTSDVDSRQHSKWARVLSDVAMDRALCVYSRQCFRRRGRCDLIDTTCAVTGSDRAFTPLLPPAPPSARSCRPRLHSLNRSPSRRPAVSSPTRPVHAPPLLTTPSLRLLSCPLAVQRTSTRCRASAPMRRPRAVRSCRPAARRTRRSTGSNRSTAGARSRWTGPPRPRLLRAAPTRPCRCNIHMCISQPL